MIRAKKANQFPNSACAQNKAPLFREAVEYREHPV